MWWKREHTTLPLTALYLPLSALGHATLNLHSSSISSKPKCLKKTEAENYWLQRKGFPELIGNSESPNRSKHPLRSHSCQESSINKSKLPHKATTQVPAEAFTFSGTLSSMSWVHAEKLPLNKPVIEYLFRHAYRISYFHRELRSQKSLPPYRRAKGTLKFPDQKTDNNNNNNTATREGNTKEIAPQTPKTKG